jgi:heptosyltransferase-3
MRALRSEQWLYLFNMLLSRVINRWKNPAQVDPYSILCIKWDEIGDMAVCTHVFEALKLRYPGSKITVICKAYSAPLLYNNNFVDEVKTEIAAFSKRYDLLVELRGTWGSFWRSIMLPPGFRVDRGRVRFKQRGAQPHESITNFRIVQPLMPGIQMPEPRIFTDISHEAKVDAFLHECAIEKYAVMHAGARDPLRRWEPYKFAEIADWLYTNYNLTTVLTGTQNEEEQLREIVAHMKNKAVLFTRDFDLIHLAALLKKASLFLGNESGPLQIADVMGTPCLGLFGIGAPVVFYPRNPRARYIHHPEDPRMERITVEEVKEKILEILAVNKG